MLDPEPDIEEASVVMTPADQLDADRQSVRPLAGGQGQARHVEQCPQPVEDRIARRGEPLRRLTGGGEGEDRIEPPGPFLGRRPGPLGTAQGGAEIVEAQLAAGGDESVGEEVVAEQRRVAVQLGAGSAGGMRIETDDGTLTGRLAEGLPEVDLKPVREMRPDAGIPLEPGELRIGFALVGVPHLVVLCDDVTVVDAVGRGRPLRRHPSLPQGANVNFVSRGRDGWWIRTYERGVEAETLACGTGAVATAVLLNVWGRSEPAETALQTKSGRRLTVRLEPEAGAWKPTLRGEGRLVFEGQLPA